MEALRARYAATESGGFRRITILAGKVYAACDRVGLIVPIALAGIVTRWCCLVMIMPLTIGFGYCSTTSSLTLAA